MLLDDGNVVKPIRLDKFEFCLIRPWSNSDATVPSLRASMVQRVSGNGKKVKGHQPHKCVWVKTGYTLFLWNRGCFMVFSCTGCDI